MSPRSTPAPKSLPNVVLTSISLRLSVPRAMIAPWGTCSSAARPWRAAALLNPISASQTSSAAPGLRRLRVALPYVDGGAASPKETWLRLLLIEAGLPPPTTQIPVFDGYRTVAFLDLGWEQFKVAAEYDGDQHRSDRRQYVKDIRRHELVDDLGWYVVRVVSEDRSSDVIDRIYNALWRRGYRRDRR